MTKEAIAALDHPTNYKKRDSSMNAWLNVIYKMMAHGFSNEIIYFTSSIKNPFMILTANSKIIFILLGKIIFQTEPYSIEKQLWNGYYRQK